MTHAFTPTQSAEIDDRIVEMIVAAIGEGAAARSARAIANTRYLDRQGEADDADGILPADMRPIATAPRDRFLLTHCPEAPRCSTWPTAPWILARWRDVTDAWHDEEGIRVHPTGWLPLTSQSLRYLSPEDSGPQALAPEAPPHHSNGATIMTAAETIRLECLKLAAAGVGNATTVLDAARRFERFVTASTIQVADNTRRATCDESVIDIENDGSVTSMLPDE